MSIEIEQGFTIKAPIGEVWSFLTDPHRVAACLPGAAITGQEDQTYTGTMNIKVGPVMSSYKGKMQFSRLDRDTWTAEIKASGHDVRGKGGADMKMTSQLRDGAGGTEVTVKSEVAVIGILAQFGRGMIQDVSDQLFQQFTAAMRTELEAGGGRDDANATPAATPAKQEALDVGALGVRVGRKALQRTMSRPSFWASAAVLALAIYWIWLR